MFKLFSSTDFKLITFGEHRVNLGELLTVPERAKVFAKVIISDHVRMPYAV